MTAASRKSMDSLFDAVAQGIAPEIRRSAVLSPCGKYRYELRRVWDDSKPLICWIMLNPSTADAEVDDPTIRRCMAFSRRWGAGGIVVVNLFALRATDPWNILTHQFPVSAPDDGKKDWLPNVNDTYIANATGSSQCEKIVAAWGTSGPNFMRDGLVMNLLRHHKVECLGLTKDGHPRHPLYVRSDVKPIAFRRKEEK